MRSSLLRRLLGLCGVMGTLVACVDAGNSPAEKISVINSTSQTVTVVYLEPADEAPGSPGAQELAVLGPGERESFKPRPFVGEYCLKAPFVVVSADGSELERVPEGTCYADPIEIRLAD